MTSGGSGFHVFITTDKNLSEQQNTGRHVHYCGLEKLQQPNIDGAFHPAVYYYAAEQGVSSPVSDTCL
jgi:hypothetical protein